MRSRTCTRVHLDFSCLAFGQGVDERRPFSPRPFELLQNSHLNSIGKDLFDLFFFACELELAPCASRNCVKEHNREPAVSNVHLYGYYHGPWGSRWWVAHSQDRSALSLSGLADFFKEKDSGVNQSMGSEQISALITRRRCGISQNQ